MESNEWSQVPKVELHVHLDCSMSYQAVRHLSPNLSLEEYQATFVAPERCEDLASFLACVTKSVDVMQSRAALRLAVESLFEQWSRDHVVYGELRFAPLLHSHQTLAAEQVVETVLEATRERMEQTNIEASVILCTLRHFTKAQSLATAGLVKAYADHGVVGLDLAADEANYPLTPHIEAFRAVQEAGVSTTAHAGEAGGAESVMETLRLLKPKRIGHGVRSIEDPHVVDELIARGVHLEVCPNCNVQIGVFPSLSAHPLAQLRSRGVSIGINTDGRSVVGTTLEKDYGRIAKTFGWELADFHDANARAADAAFVGPERREQILRRLGRPTLEA